MPIVVVQNFFGIVVINGDRLGCFLDTPNTCVVSDFVKGEENTLKFL
ncbi:MAG: hypothetical protein ACREPR_22920 [Brasilonema sp.]